MHLLLDAGHADHEEFIEVGGEDRGEIAAFQQRLVFVLGEFEDSLVELQPAEFSVEIAIRGQPALRPACGSRLSGLSVSAMCSAIWLRRIAFEGASNVCAMYITLARIWQFSYAACKKFSGCLPFSYGWGVG